MKKYPKAHQNNPGIEEVIKKFEMAKKKFDKPEKLSRKQIRKLEPGQSYITRKGKIAWKRTRKERIEDGLLTILEWILFPFLWIGNKIGRAFHNFFFMKTNFQNNGIIDPGYASWHEEHFSWGKLSFVLVIAFIIVYFIFLR